MIAVIDIGLAVGALVEFAVTIGLVLVVLFLGAWGVGFAIGRLERDRGWSDRADARRRNRR